METFTRKIKILRVIARLNIGGPAIHTILLSGRLNSGVFESQLVKGSEGPFEGNMMPLAREKRVNPVLIPEMGRNISWIDDFKALGKLYRMIQSEKPNIIHTHTAKAGTLGRLAASIHRLGLRLQRKKREFFGHGLKDEQTPDPVILHTFHGHIFKGYFGRGRTWVFSWIERLLALQTDKIIVLSDVLKNELVQMKVAPLRKILVVPLGLELEPFLQNRIFQGTFKKSLGLPPESLLVGMVGRLVPIKGHFFFLEAAKRVLEAQPVIPVPVKFVVIGDGELRLSLEERARQLGIREDVLFTGFRSDLPMIYADLDVVALTSLNEGTPVSLIEAMVSGKPVVATKVGGVPDLVEEGRTGLLVESGNPAAIAAAVRRLLTEPETRRQMGILGQAAVYPKYDINNLVRNMGEIYLSLLRQRDLQGYPRKQMGAQG